MNLAYKFPIIFWNTACLISDSGGSDEDEDEEPTEEIVDIYEKEDFENYEYIDAPDRKTKLKKKRKGTKYDKVAIAIGKMQQNGIQIKGPQINKSSYTFTPDIESNTILFGFKGLLNVGEETIQAIINNRPYESVQDFIDKVQPGKQAMISLIKCGAFDSFGERKEIMKQYILDTCGKKQKVTLQNMGALMEYNLIPDDNFLDMAKRVYEFNRYLKAICKQQDKYKLDDRALAFIEEINEIDIIDQDFYVSIKAWDKVYQKWMNIIRSWLATNKDQVLAQLNNKIFVADWIKYALGSYSTWEMETMCFYEHPHELLGANKEKYGIQDFADLTENPQIERSFKKGNAQINLYKLTKICGTCIAKNKQKSTISLLTTDGVVTVKFRKEYFSIFDKQISELQSDGKKKVMEKSWFKRGNLLVVQGYRRDNEFVPKKYATSTGHELYKINHIDSEGNLTLQTERYKGIYEDE